MAAAGNPNELDEAINTFRTTEAALDKLAQQTGEVATAQALLATTQASLDALAASGSKSLAENAALSTQLAALASDLAEATDVLRQVDPAEIHQQLTRLSADFERQKERISEMTGETRARIEESTRLTTSAIDLSSAETVSVLRKRIGALTASIADSDKATAVRQKTTEVRLLVSMSALAAILLIVELATT